jgi:hypothetical protein
MENRNLMKALEIVSRLMTGERVGADAGASLYEEYSTNSEVYDILMEICRNLNIIYMNIIMPFLLVRVTEIRCLDIPMRSLSVLWVLGLIRNYS